MPACKQERGPSGTGRSTARSRTRSAACGLSHAKSDKLVYCHEALHLKDKLQKAGYKAKMVKWDSDSDSDEMYDEKDLM